MKFLKEWGEFDLLESERNPGNKNWEQWFRLQHRENKHCYLDVCFSERCYGENPRYWDAAIQGDYEHSHHGILSIKMRAELWRETLNLVNWKLRQLNEQRTIH